MRTAAKSMATTTWMMMMVILLIVAFSSPSTTAEQREGLTEKAEVSVINGLSKPLTAHCQSKDTDFGEKVLALGGSFSWKFYPNLIPTTLYFCSFVWDGSGGRHTFDIYVENRDIERCTYCDWTIYEKGPCLYNRATKLYDVCYPFKS